MIPSNEPLKSWLRETYLEYFNKEKWTLKHFGLYFAEKIPEKLKQNYKSMKRIILITILQLCCLALISQKKVHQGAQLSLSLKMAVYFSVEMTTISIRTNITGLNGRFLKYGVIWIGTPDNPQQGVNEKALRMIQTDFRGLKWIRIQKEFLSPENITTTI